VASIFLDLHKMEAKMQENDKNTQESLAFSKTTGRLLLVFGLTTGTLCTVFGDDVADNAKDMYAKAVTATHEMSKPETILRLTSR
jgi:hypothetical protein